ncbi:ATPase, T2SS/T4P/T4SS family [Undibacterium arcticum]
MRPLADLGLAKPLIDKLLARDMRGLVLIVGEMATGKTSTASSLVVEWLKLNGGVGIALEDPVETPLNAIWGDGKCYQIPVSDRRGGYKSAMRKALRTGSNIMLIGEIRDETTAAEVLKASINGHYVISTLHAGGLVQGIERMSAYCKSELEDTNQLMADGLAMVIWLSSTKKYLRPVVLTSPELKHTASKLKIWSRSRRKSGMAK